MNLEIKALLVSQATWWARFRLWFCREQMVVHEEDDGWSTEIRYKDLVGARYIISVRSMPPPPPEHFNCRCVVDPLDRIEQGET